MADNPGAIRDTSLQRLGLFVNVGAALTSRLQFLIRPTSSNAVSRPRTRFPRAKGVINRNRREPRASSPSDTARWFGGYKRVCRHLSHERTSGLLPRDAR